MSRMRLTSRKMLIGLAGVLGVLATVFVFGTVPDVLARVSGVCSNCHTMHNSQNGESVTTGGVGALNNLLKQDCAGCHSSSGSSTWKDSVTGAPIVYTIGAAPQFGPSYGGGDQQGLAGGNFYWVEQAGGDAKGHNVFLDNIDDALNEAPGRDVGCAYSGVGCHFSLAKQIPQSASEIGARGRYGCTGCHMFSDEAYINGGNPSAHHADDTTTSGVITSSAQGYYRYLFGHQGSVGVKGIEDANWEKDPSAGRNEYLGDEGLTRTSAPLGMAGRNGAISGFCVGCHAKFHIEQDGSDMWIRHPADAVLPNSYEYAAAITLGDLVRVGRPALNDLPADRKTARPGKDMVMCLSCHRAHGSPYDDMLRWDYNAMTTGNTGAGGCFVCHTEKDDAP